MKIHRITSAITSFFTTQLLCICLPQTLHTLYKSSPSKCKFSDFPLFELKFTKLLMSFFKQKSVFLQGLGLISVSWEIMTSAPFYAIDKSSTLKCKFSDLPLLILKFTKFLMSFLEPKVRFSSNFASLFSVM